MPLTLGQSYFHKDYDYLDFDSKTGEITLRSKEEMKLTDEEAKKLFMAMMIHYKARKEEFWL